MTHDPPEQVVEVFPGIDLAGLARLDESQKQGGGAGPAIAGREEPVLPVMLSSA